MRKSNLFSLALLSAAWFAGNPAQAIEQDVDGYYLIGTKAELQEWTQISDYLTSKAKLTANIDDVDFMLSSGYFKGTFDGQGHTITLNNPSYPTGENKAIALFASTSGSTIKNLIVGGTITTGVKNSAGISTWNGGASTFENILVIVDINYTSTTDNGSNAAFVGYCKQNATFNNCVAAPRYTGTKGNNNGFIGWRGGGNVYLNNCICIVEAEGDADLNSVSLSNPSSNVTAKNTYVVKMTYDPATPVSNSVYVTKAQMASGEIAYAINQAAGSTLFYQNLEGDAKDAFPVPFSSHAVVYANGKANCDGSPKEGSEITYSNKDALVQDPHTDVDGFCIVCGNVLRDHIAPVDGVYPLATAKDMVWFAAMVNEAGKSDIAAELTADIDFKDIDYQPIGNSYTTFFDGSFDGKAYKISNLVIDTDDDTPLGLFGVVGNNAVLKNIFLDGTCSLKGAGFVAGIAASGTKTSGAGFQIRNCVNAATIESTGNKASAFYAQDPASQNNQANFVIDNCANVGNITAPGNGSIASVFCGWANTSLCSVYNSYNIGQVTNYQADNVMFFGKNRFMNNCYDLIYGIDDSQQGFYAWSIAKPATDGELAAQLGCNFYQKSTDAYPVPFYTEGSSRWNKITTAGYSTFYAKEATFIPAGVTAYTGKINGQYLTLTAIEGSVIPAKTPVVLKGAAGIYEMKVTTDEGSVIADNDLQASEETVNPDGKQYILGMDNAEVGFYKAAIGQSGKWNYMIAPGKAFLVIPEGTDVKGFVFAEDGETAINEVNGQSSNGQSIYNLAGQRLGKMQKGINIVNGKKVLK